MPEVRRLLLAVNEPPERLSFRLTWARFRRRHQALAQEAHGRRRERGQPAAAEPPTIKRLTWTVAEVSDARWERIVALLPPLATVGRPAQEPRRLLAGMLWVMQRGAAWREAPAEFGSWHTLYRRYHEWRAAGLWDAILAVLAPDPPAVPAELSL